MEYDIDDWCVYFDLGVCCHPDLVMLRVNEVTKEYCSKCLFKKLPIKIKAIKLLQELRKSYLEAKEKIELLPENNSVLNILEEYDEKNKEVTNFLISLNVISKELNTLDEIEKLIMENKDVNIEY